MTTRPCCWLLTATAVSGYLNDKLGICIMSRARIAVLSRDRNGRKGCNYSGRCLWGCPRHALYTPSLTLAECRGFSNFSYFGGLYADHVRMDSAEESSLRRGNPFLGRANTRIRGWIAGARRRDVVLNAFSGIDLSGDREAPQLRGVMDNRQILMPFVNLRMLGRPWNPNTYQYHQAAMAVRVKESGELIHGLITTLKTALIHPLVQTLPFDLRTAVSMFRSVHGALGMVNINFPDHRREENYVTLDTTCDPHQLVIHYEPRSDEPERLKHTIAVFRRILGKLGCFAPQPTVHVRPMGASVHYAGTVPMTDDPAPWTCTKQRGEPRR